MEAWAVGIQDPHGPCPLRIRGVSGALRRCFAFYAFEGAYGAPSTHHIFEWPFCLPLGRLPIRRAQG